MKQILALVIIITMIVTGCNNVNNSILESSASYEQIRVNNTDISAEVEIGHTSAPYIILVRGENELSEMFKMVESSEKEILEYLERAGYFYQGLQNSKDFITFVELLCEIPIPYTKGFRFESLDYYIEDEDGFSYISFVNEIGDRLTFRCWLNSKPIDGVVEQRAWDGGERLIEAYQKRDDENKIKIYMYTEDSGAFPSENGVYFMPMEINGYYMVELYKPYNGARVTSDTIEERYRDIDIVSLADEPWTARAEDVVRDSERGQQ